MRFMIRETHVNAEDKDKPYIYADFEEEAEMDGVGDIYRTYARNYGRCTGKVYIDTKSGKTREIGWVFVKRVPYETRGGQQPRTYLREVWVVPYG